MTDSLSTYRVSRPKRFRAMRRHPIRTGVTFVVVGFLVWLAVSLGGALTNPALGSSASARLAEWARGHGGASAVNWIENEWYTHHPPKVGGKPPAGAIRRPGVAPTTAAAGPAHLPPPTPVAPAVSPAIPGEGAWSPTGRLVGGVPAVYETTLRPDPVHTSYVVGVAWMDTKLLRATLYSGSQIPGGGPFIHIGTHSGLGGRQPGGGVQRRFPHVHARRRLLHRRTERGFRYGQGAASFVVYANGTATVGSWGADASMTPQVVSVRQNLDLLVVNGQPAPGPQRRRHVEVGVHPRQPRLRLALRTGSDRRRRPGLRGWTGYQHLRPR